MCFWARRRSTKPDHSRADATNGDVVRYDNTNNTAPQVVLKSKPKPKLSTAAEPLKPPKAPKPQVLKAKPQAAKPPPLPLKQKQKQVVESHDYEEEGQEEDYEELDADHQEIYEEVH